MRRNYIHDKVLAKAKKLVRDNRVELLDNGNYNVIGDHGTYNVVIGLTGIIACNCPGYRDKGSCSHSTAVSMLPRRRNRR
jgi:hypothetical protein